MSDIENIDVALNSSYSFNEKQTLIIKYIEKKTDTINYLKSKDISHDIDSLTSQEVGSNMPRIAKRYEGLTIERWSESSDITWRIKR